MLWRRWLVAAGLQAKIEWLLCYTSAITLKLNAGDGGAGRGLTVAELDIAYMSCVRRRFSEVLSLRRLELRGLKVSHLLDMRHDSHRLT